MRTRTPEKKFKNVRVSPMYLFFCVCVCVKCVVGDCEEALPILGMLVASKNFSLVGSFSLALVFFRTLSFTESINFPLVLFELRFKTRRGWQRVYT